MSAAKKKAEEGGGRGRGGEGGGGEAMDGMQSEQSEGNPRLKGVLIPGQSLCQYKLWIKTGQGPYYTKNLRMQKKIFSLQICKKVLNMIHTSNNQ